MEFLLAILCKMFIPSNWLLCNITLTVCRLGMNPGTMTMINHLKALNSNLFSTHLGFKSFTLVTFADNLFSCLLLSSDELNI